jgi:hypothetical protein
MISYFVLKNTAHMISGLVRCCLKVIGVICVCMMLKFWYTTVADVIHPKLILGSDLADVIRFLEANNIEYYEIWEAKLTCDTA